MILHLNLFRHPGERLVLRLPGLRPDRHDEDREVPLRQGEEASGPDPGSENFSALVCFCPRGFCVTDRAENTNLLRRVTVPWIEDSACSPGFNSLSIYLFFLVSRAYGGRIEPDTVLAWYSAFEIFC